MIHLLPSTTMATKLKGYHQTFTEQRGHRSWSNSLGYACLLDDVCCKGVAADVQQLFMLFPPDEVRVELLPSYLPLRTLVDAPQFHGTCEKKSTVWHFVLTTCTRTMPVGSWPVTMDSVAAKTSLQSAILSVLPAAYPFTKYDSAPTPLRH